MTPYWMYVVGFAFVVYIAIWKEGFDYKGGGDVLFKGLCKVIGWALMGCLIVIGLVFLMIGLSGLTATTIIIIILLVWLINHQE